MKFSSYFYIFKHYVFWVLWNIFFWWTGEYINFTCYNVVFYNHYSIYLRRAENLVAHATETKNVPKLVPWLKQKISDFCGSNVGIFKWLFSRQKMSAKYFMMHKKKLEMTPQKCIEWNLAFSAVGKIIQSAFWTKIIDENQNFLWAEMRNCISWTSARCVWKIGRTNLAAQIRKSFSLLWKKLEFFN